MSSFFSHTFRRGARESEPAAPPAPVPGRAGTEHFEHDPVAVALLNAGLVRIEQAEKAQRYASTNRPLWRVLVALDGVDRTRALELVARVQGFEAVQIGLHPKHDFVQAVLALVPPVAICQMWELNLLPYNFGYDAATQTQKLILATHDPAAEEVQAFVQALGSEVSLVYAEETAVRTRLERALSVLEEQQAAEGDGAAPAGTPTPQGDGYYGHAAPEPVVHGDGAATGAPTFEAPVVEAPIVDAPAREPEPPAAAPAPPPAAASPAPEPPAAAAPAEPEPEEEPSAAPLPTQSRDRVVALLLHKRIVTGPQVEAARRVQEKDRSKEALWRVLADATGVDREAIFAEAARVYAFPAAPLKEGQPSSEFVRSAMATFAEDKRDKLVEMRVIPLECEVDAQNGAARLVFVTHDPARPEVHRLLHSLRLERYELQYAPEGVVRQAIADAYPRKNEFLDRLNEGGGAAVDLGMSFEDKASGLIDEDALEAEIGRSALINLFEATLIEAVRQGASDIHIFPNARRKIEIHFRVDGRLVRWYTEEKVHPEALLAVIKDNSTNVDRFERDEAQDGFIQRKIDDALIRFRVSVLPIATANPDVRAESIVIRILDDRKVVTDLRKLGLLDTALERFDRAIRQPHGMVILTGPTGSGKSTTLVASLYQVVTPEVNVLTVEDPVEYIIPGVRQIKLSHKLNLEGAMRAILRHDPDVVMVGEMRDRDTAELAIKLANTGHLTFSTLHTNDAPSAISRLYKMGVEPFLIAYAINLVVAQRLIRSLCPRCKTPDPDPDTVLMKRMGFTADEMAQPMFKAKGCSHCKNTGYKGRRAITEALYFSRDIRHMIVEASEAIDEDAIRTLARKEGMLTLLDSARELVKMGDTSLEEMVRVTASEH